MAHSACFALGCGVEDPCYQVGGFAVLGLAVVIEVLDHFDMIAKRVDLGEKSHCFERKRFDDWEWQMVMCHEMRKGFEMLTWWSLERARQA